LGHLYRLAQLREIFMRFREAHGREASNQDELTKWVAKQEWPDRPVNPRPEAFLVIA
jgi:hypothetical protein